MGWTGYFDMTAREAVDCELRGLRVLRSSGAWRVVCDAANEVHIVLGLTERHGREVAVKIVDASMGPMKTAPEALYRYYLRVRNPDRPVTEYEREWRDRCERVYASKESSRVLVPGSRFTLRSPMHFVDGVSEDTFIFVGKFRARRATDGALVRLSRSFRSMIVSTVDA